MFKLCILLIAAVACASAKPTLLAAPVAYTAGVAAPVAYTAPVVTATSSQYVARNYNGIVASPYVAAPLTYPYASAAYSYPYASAPLSYPYASAYTSYVV